MANVPQVSELEASERVGVTAFARLLGVSQPAVTKAVAAGRVTSVERDAKGRVWIVNVAQAKRQWVENAAKPTKPGGPRRRAAVLTDRDGVASLSEMQRRVAIERERKLRFENDLRRGLFVRVSEVKKEAFDSARIVREGLLNLTARLAPELAAESDPSKVFAMLDAEIRAALTSVAEALERAAS